jgi:hypothetical protein
MAGRYRRHTGGTGARAAGAHDDTGLRLVRCRLLKDLLGANQGPLIRKTVVCPGIPSENGAAWLVCQRRAAARAPPHRARRPFSPAVGR